MLDTRDAGERLAVDLRAFLECSDPAEMPHLWRGIEGTAFAQTTVFEVAEPITDVLVASLVDDRPSFVHAWTLEALRFILEGGSHTDPDLPRRCMDRARMGVWALAGCIPTLDEADRSSALHLLRLLDPLAANYLESGYGN